MPNPALRILNPSTGINGQTVGGRRNRPSAHPGPVSGRGAAILHTGDRGGVPGANKQTNKQTKDARRQTGVVKRKNIYALRNNCRALARSLHCRQDASHPGNMLETQASAGREHRNPVQAYRQWAQEQLSLVRRGQMSQSHPPAGGKRRGSACMVTTDPRRYGDALTRPESISSMNSTDWLLALVARRRLTHLTTGSTCVLSTK